MSDTKKEPAKRKRVPPAYFWPGGGFYTPNARKEWQKTDTSTMRMIFIKAGHRSDKDTVGLSPCSQQLLNVIQNNSIHYAGEISGYKTGLHQIGPYRFLVTQECRLPKPVKGSCETWLNILGIQYREQLPYLLAWLKAARMRVETNGGPMLPALVIGGKAGTGKSLVQNHLITPLLGGRAGMPFRYWRGKTEFNDDFCGTEHLKVEDEFSPMNAEIRQMVSENIKQAVANTMTSMHPKGLKAVPVKVCWCVTITMNLAPHNLKMLPLHDEGMEDKLLVLMCKDRPEILPLANDIEAYQAMEKKLHDEIPAFVQFLREFDIAPEFQGPRSLVFPYRNPEIVALVQEDDKVTRLMHVIDKLEIADPSWTGTSYDLKDIIKSKTSHNEAEMLGNVGYTLRDAAKRFPHRISQSGEAHEGKTKWRILSASSSEAQPEQPVTTEGGGGAFHKLRSEMATRPS